ncbi:MAG: mechanosensitive ion channel family protein, partial [Eubacterium sp.]|nr:mechanosensitive ion channel family protein [Eubacterium sp.]
GITINYQHKIVTDSFKIFTILIVCWSILCYISDNLQTAFNLKSDNKAVNGVAVKFISNILKVIIVCIAVVMVLAELGYNINGLITGLGVGGLAVSLSAQDTLKNLISGFVILFDKPFDVGFLIETAEFQGVVEDITMRSTRIRKPDDSVIIVPNSSLSDSSISNYTRLTRKLVEFKIGLLYSTPAETVKKCEADIKEYLDKNETVDSETIRVYFTEYDESSINILIRCYICTTDIEVYYKFLEELNFEIKQIVESNKTDFAFPTRSIYIEKN